MKHISFLGWLIPSDKTLKSINYFGSAVYFFSTGLLAAMILETVDEINFRYGIYAFISLCGLKCIKRLIQGTNGISLSDAPWVASLLSRFSPPDRLVDTVKIIGRLCSAIFYSVALSFGLVTTIAGQNLRDEVVFYLGAFVGLFGLLKFLQRIAQAINVNEFARQRKQKTAP